MLAWRRRSQGAERAQASTSGAARSSGLLRCERLPTQTLCPSSRMIHTSRSTTSGAKSSSRSLLALIADHIRVFGWRALSAAASKRQRVSRPGLVLNSASNSDFFAYTRSASARFPIAS